MFGGCPNPPCPPPGFDPLSATPGPTIGPVTPGVAATTPDEINAARVQALWQAIQASQPKPVSPADQAAFYRRVLTPYKAPAPQLPGAQPAVSTAAGPSRTAPITPEAIWNLHNLASGLYGLTGLSDPAENIAPTVNGQPHQTHPIQNTLALAGLLGGGIADVFQSSKLISRAATALKEGGTFDVSTGRALQGDGYLVADPRYTRTILPHEDPKQVISSFLKDPQVQQRLASGDSHLGVFTNPDGLPEVNVTDRIPDEASARELAQGRGQNSFGHMQDSKYQGDIPAKRDLSGRRVTGVALQDIQGNIHSKPLPASHLHVLNDLPSGTALQSRGFTLDDGTYVTPEEAMGVAEQQDQVNPGRFERNRTNPRDLHAFDLKENAPQPPAKSYSVEDEGPAEHLANAQSIVDMHAQMSGKDATLDPADVDAIRARVAKAGKQINITPSSTVGDVQAQLRGLTPAKAGEAMPLDEVGALVRHRAGLTHEPLPPVGKVDEELGQHMAQAYSRMESAPNDPQVQSSYRKFSGEVAEQAKALKNAGYSWEFTDQDPYKNSAEMLQDLNENHHIKVLRTQPGQGHPLLSNAENDEFRAVHDILGHGSSGASFGPRGEEQAYRNHAALFSPESQRVLATETRGQNSWFNYGPNSKLPVKERPFAQQKAGLFPQHLTGDYPQARVGANLDLPKGAPEELGASPGHGYEGPEPETGPTLPVKGELANPSPRGLLSPPATGAAPTEGRALAQGLSRDEAVARMKSLAAEGVKAQMQPQKDGTFSIMRKGDAHPGTAVAPQKKGLLAKSLGPEGEPYESGFQSRLVTGLNDPKYQKLNLTPQQWYNTLAHDPNIPKGELDAIGLDPDATLQARTQAIKAQWTRTQSDYLQGEIEGHEGALNNARNYIDERLHSESPTMGEVAAFTKFHDAMKGAFHPGEEIRNGGFSPMSLEDMAQTFDPAMQELQRSLEGSEAGRNLEERANQFAQRYNMARERYNDAISAADRLHVPPDFGKRALDLQNESQREAGGRLQSRLDAKGRMGVEQMKDFANLQTPVGNLSTETLEAEGGHEPQEPDEDEIQQRVDNLRENWQSEIYNNAAYSVERRDHHLEDANELLGERLGQDQAYHQNMLDAHFPERQDLADNDKPDYVDKDKFTNDLEEILSDEGLSNDDRTLLKSMYNTARNKHNDAVDAFRDYWNGDNEPDFHQEALDEWQREHGDEGEPDRGNTEYSKYQRVDENAPYREILVRDPTKESMPSGHWGDYPGTIAHARGELHDDGQNYLMIEAQSDMAQKAGRSADADQLDQLKPFETTERWGQLATGASLRQAAQEGANSFSWVTPQNRREAASLDLAAGNITYGHAVPKAVERIFKYLDEPLVKTDDPGHGMPTVKLTPAMRSKILKAGVPALGLSGLLIGGVRKKD